MEKRNILRRDFFLVCVGEEKLRCERRKVSGPQRRRTTETDNMFHLWEEWGR